MITDYWQALGGGMLIGLAALFLMLFNGKIAGISGVIQGAIWQKETLARYWRIAFLIGLILGSWITLQSGLISFEIRQDFPLWALALSGLLVGIGTSIGSGCTSGHGVCGIGRLSQRSILATVIFMASASLTVWVIRHLLGGL